MNSVTKKIVALTLDGVPPERACAALAILEGRTPERNGSSQAFWDVKQAMSQCGGLSRSQLWKMRLAGLPSYKVGSRVLFKPAEVEAYIRGN